MVLTRARAAIMLILAAASFAACPLVAQNLRSIPPYLDPAFWGMRHRPYAETFVVTTSGSGGSAHTGKVKYYRDDAGQVRVDSFYDSGLPMTATLCSPGRDATIFLQAVARIAWVESFPQPNVAMLVGSWRVEALPAKTIAGVLAQGERFTRTQTDKSQNRTPRIATEDIWFSDELGVVLMRTWKDTRTGEITTYTATQIQPVEPDPSLFTIPDDYEIKQGPSMRR